MIRSARTPMESLISILFFCSSLLSILTISSAADTITTAQFIRDGDSIVSSSGSFEMGFFSPGTGSSKNRYLGIWYKKISTGTVVWVANRDIPLTDTSGVFQVTHQGILILHNITNTIIWFSNMSRTAQEPVAQLLESGNLVVKEANDDSPDNFRWQSFDYPCDTFLPGMQLGKNLETGQDWNLSSWKSSDDPAPGDFTYWCDVRGYPQFLVSNGSVELFRSGPWNGVRFSGYPSSKAKTLYKFNFVFREKEVYYINELTNGSVVSRAVLNHNGLLERLTWSYRTQRWTVSHNAPMDICDNYSKCGAYGSCKIGNSQVCSCLDKFVPKYPTEWDMADWSNGCVRRMALDCHNGSDGFLKYSNVKLPDTRYSLFNGSMTLDGCKTMCLKNCSCLAYANSNVSEGGSGCLLWFGDLIDIREFPEDGQDIYIRMASSELGQSGSTSKKGMRFIVSLVLTAGMMLLGLGITLFVWKKYQQCYLDESFCGRMRHNSEQGYNSENQNEDLQLSLFDLATIAKATNNFSVNNKLGEGGFGPVYKGLLTGGQEIAVKRLSKNSKQGHDEFKNEVICIAKLQHRNLIKLMGYCLQREENMLIYEYMPNKSLDFFIFDQARSTLLDWPKRFHIISGIARGLLYLHQDPRLRIIHRDLKASNILLDCWMNPKISDFGIARIFGGSETVANTKRVIGTYGYMSPEYAIDGLFSVKSDVFSFGVLMLEIVSGKRDRGFNHPGHNLNLLGHAWELYKEDRALELIDASVWESCNLYEVSRSVHVGLLCVQQCAEDRPCMSSVVVMLGGKGELPQPKQPGFFTERSFLDATSSLSKHGSCSPNQVTVTVLDAR